MRAEPARDPVPAVCPGTWSGNSLCSVHEESCPMGMPGLSWPSQSCFRKNASGGDAQHSSGSDVTVCQDLPNQRHCVRAPGSAPSQQHRATVLTLLDPGHVPGGTGDWSSCRWGRGTSQSGMGHGTGHPGCPRSAQPLFPEGPHLLVGAGGGQDCAVEVASQV